MSICPFALTPNDARITTYPIERMDLWQFVKRAQRSHWIADEITFTIDPDHYNGLPADQRECINNILGFFAGGDAIVNVNLTQRFKQDVPILEVTYFYNQQISQEDIHAETYSIQLNTIVRDEALRNALFDAVRSRPAIARIAAWMYDTIDSDAPFAERLLRMACVEGIFFQGCFCIIYWFASRALMPGLVTANQFIARDEALHTDFALYLYLMLKPEHQLPTSRVHEIFASAVDIGTAFTHDMMPNAMPEMNADLMSDYLRYVADALIVSIEQPRLWPSIAKNPMQFMEMINLPERTNFFELRGTQYSGTTRADREEFEIATEF